MTPEGSRLASAPSSGRAEEVKVGVARAALFFLALALLYFAPALAPGRLLFGTDYLAGGYAFYDFSARELAAGVLPRWVPHVFGGLPLFANPGSTFYPVHLLASLVLPTERVLPTVLVVQFWLAGLGMFLLARELGCRGWVALVTGVLYQFTGLTLSWIYAGHDGRIIVATLAPLALALLHRGLRSGRVASFAGAAATLGSALLSFQIQVAWYLLLAGALWTAAVLAGLRRELARRALVSRAALALGVAGFAFALAAVNFLPFHGHLAASSRGGEEGEGYAFATTFSMEPRSLVGIAVPEQVGSSATHPVSGELQLPPYRGDNPLKLHTEHVGALVVVLLALGGWIARARRTWWLLLALGSFFLSLALGSHTPLYGLYLQVLPGLRRFRAPDLAYFMVALSMVAMAGVALEQLARHRERSSPPTTAILWIGGAVLCAGLLGAGWAWSHPAVGPDGPIASATSGWLRFAGASAAGTAIVWVWSRGRAGARAALVAMSVLAIADLWGVGRRFFFVVPGPETLFAADDVERFLRTQRQPARVWVLPIPEPYRGGANHPMQVGLQQAGGEHPLPSRRYVEYFGAGRTTTLDWHNVLERPRLVDSAQGPALAFDSRPALLDAANIRFIVSVAPLALHGLREVFRGERAIVYENPRARPRAWLVPRAVRVAGGDESLRAVLAPGWDPARVAFVEASEDPGIDNHLAVGAALVTEHGTTRVTVRAWTDRPALLVLADTYDPGWRATVDGREAKVLIANHAFRGVVVPAGEHVVRFDYRPERLYLGLAVSLTAFALLLGLGLGSLARRPPWRGLGSGRPGW